MFYKNETTKFIEVLIGTSSTGVENVTNWAVAESGNWAGWSNNLEAPNVTKIGNNWNILLDAEGSGIYYSTAPVSGGLLGTWSPKALISSPSTMQHGMLLPQPPGYGSGTPSSDWAQRSGAYAALSTWQTFISGMVSDGNWSSLDAVYGLATTGTAQALLNIKSNGFALVPSGSPAFSSTTGYAGNGSTAILDTTFVPNFPAGYNYKLNAASLTVCITNSRVAGAAAAVFGVNQGSNASDLFPWYTDNNFYAELNANGTGVATSTNIQGIWVISRTASNAVAVYHNNTVVASPTTASSTVPGLSFYLLSDHNSGGILNPSSDSVGFFAAGGALTATQAGQIYTRVHALGISGC